MPEPRPLAVPGAADALEALRPGQRLTYHRGFIAVDAELSANVREVRDKAQALIEAGRITVRQNRLGDGAYEYVATDARRSPDAA